MIRLVIAEDQVLLREMMLSILKEASEFVVVGSASNGEDALSLCSRYRPDLVLLDIKMPKLNGIEVLSKIKKEMPQIKVILLTTFEEEEDISKAFCMGVDGYLLKDISPEELIRSIHCVINGLFIMSASVKAYIQKAYAINCQVESPIMVSTSTAAPISLDSVEIKMLKLIATGKSNKEIGETLGFTEGTIKNKITKLLSLLELKDRTQLVVYALTQKLI